MTEGSSPSEPFIATPEINDEEQKEPRFEINVQEEDHPFLQEELESHQNESLQAFLSEPALENKEEIKTSDDEDLAYPFGGWTDAENN